MTKLKLENLIKKHKWYYKNDNITSKNFPLPDKVETENWKVIKMDKSFTSQEALDKIKAEGCRPANVYELLLFLENHPEAWPDNQWAGMLAFGQQWQDADGRHGVPVVGRSSDGGFEFGLGCFGGGWNSGVCLLCFCDSTLETETLSKSETLTLSIGEKNINLDELKKAMRLCKDAGYKIFKEL